MALLKNIIFDLGGVLLNIDYKKTENAFKDLGYTHFEKMYSQFTADELFVKLETGKINPAGFLRVLTDSHERSITTLQVITAWNSMLLDWRMESLEFLSKLSKKYKIFLLSNTNEIHEEAFNKILYKQTGMSSVDHLFTKAWYSHKIHFRKPDAEIFEFVLKDAGISAAETLLIDDSANNIEAAKAAKINTHLLLSGERIEGLNYPGVIFDFP